MSDFTRLLNDFSQGRDTAAPEVLAAVYNELRAMAAVKLASERAGHTLQPTALVHEAYLKLVGAESPWENRAHFFAAASEAMRRILVDSARRKQAAKRGGGATLTPLDEAHLNLPLDDERLLEVHEVLDDLEADDPLKARLVKLRYFVGLSVPETAQALGLHERTARRHWELAKVWLYRAIKGA